jgi:aryl-alcohol dehydrogenase-like predicted oxidoreductase
MAEHTATTTTTTASGAVPRVTLGRTALEVSRVGFGAWAVGGGNWQGGWGSQDDSESIAAIHHAVDSGINWVDTAPAYGLGHAEEVVGFALRELPAGERPYVFTKCGLVWTEGETSVSNVLAPASIRAECEASLRRLGVERIDLLQIHWPSHDGTPVEASWATMGELVEEGKVGWIGVSNFDVDLLERCQRVRHVDTDQPELNLVNRRAAESVIPWCTAHGTGVLAYSPMASGLLTGRFSAERVRSLPDDDWRRTAAEFQEPRLSCNLALVERLAVIADRVGCSLPELSVAWVLACAGVSVAIVGARNPGQVDGWIGGASVELSDKDLDDIAEAVDDTGAGAGPTRPVAA